MSSNAELIEPTKSQETFDSAVWAQSSERIKPSTLLKFSFWYLTLTLGTLAICFGGVHEPVFLTFQASLFVTLSLLLYSKFDFVIKLLSTGPLARLMLYCSGATLVYCVCQGTVLGYTTIDTPLLEPSNSLIAPREFKSGVFEILTFTGAFLLFYLVARIKNFKQRLVWVICSWGTIISLVALAHWLSDSGKLFGIFEPIHSQTSPRARWPFVNPNHLGLYLLPTLVFSLSVVIESMSSILHSISFASIVKKRRPVSHPKKPKSAPVLVAFAIFSLATSTLAIVAAQSRGAWLGLAIAVVAYLAFDFFSTLRSSKMSLRSDAGSESKRRHRSRSSKRKDLTRYQLLARFLFLTFTALMVAVLLRDSASQKISSRLEFSVQQPLEESRMTMLRATLPMISDNLFFGTGLGSWEQLVGSYFTDHLTDNSLLYLHSDPIQLFSELGLVGIIPFLFLGVVLVKRSVAALFGMASRGQLDYTLLASFSIALGILVASFFDFHFRLPATSFLIAACLALLVVSIESPSDTRRES